MKPIIKGIFLAAWAAAMIITVFVTTNEQSGIIFMLYLIASSIGVYILYLITLAYFNIGGNGVIKYNYILDGEGKKYAFSKLAKYINNIPINNTHNGLCGVIMHLYTSDIITINEHDYLCSYLHSNKPYWSLYSIKCVIEYGMVSAYFWKAYDMEPRIKWVNKHNLKHIKQCHL